MVACRLSFTFPVISPEMGESRFPPSVFMPVTSRRWVLSVKERETCLLSRMVIFILAPVYVANL